MNYVKKGGEIIFIRFKALVCDVCNIGLILSASAHLQQSCIKAQFLPRQKKARSVQHPI